MRWILFIVIGGPLLLLLLTAWWLVILVAALAFGAVMVCEAISQSNQRQARVEAARGQVIRGPR